MVSLNLGQRAIFLGYTSGVKGYRLWCPNPKSPKFVISGDITFDEILCFNRENSMLLILQVQEIKQASRWSLRAKLQKERRRAHTLNKSMMLKIQLRVMILLKNNRTILPLRE